MIVQSSWVNSVERFGVNTAKVIMTEILSFGNVSFLF